jgi:ankyrin repeat protein
MINFTYIWLVIVFLGAAGARAVDSRGIYSAMRSGEARELEHLLASGVSPNASDENGNTLLMQAAVYGGVDSLKLLLERGAAVNAANGAGATALMRATGDLNKVKVLVDAGASVEARSALGNTALMLASRRAGSAKILEFLIERGGKVNDTNAFLATPLMAAAASGDVEMARVLLRHGADVNAHSRGSLDIAVWGGGRSPLMWASFRGDLPMMKILLDAGADANASEGFGTPLTQAAWMDRSEAAALLLEHGARVDQAEQMSAYTALHWAASSDNPDDALVKLLLARGANANAEGGGPVDAFMEVAQTPLMLARKRGETPIVRDLAAVGAKGTASKPKIGTRGKRELLDGVTEQELRQALARALPPLQATALSSKQAFLKHGSKQDCVSCHQQYFPLSAMAYARHGGMEINKTAEEEVLAMVQRDNGKSAELTWEATFHPEPAHGYGYALFALSAEQVRESADTDAMVHHLMAIQGREGQWFNNLPRPPIQTSDVAATALAVKALAAYGFPGAAQEIASRVAHARAWLWKVKPGNTEERVYQLLGLRWAGESLDKLKPLAKSLAREQREDGGWAQLPNLECDSYATGQALFALYVAGTKPESRESRDALHYLLETQLDDGSWFVARRAFPFQPTMHSGFPHGRDSWISATGTSWASMAIALALGEAPRHATSGK